VTGSSPEQQQQQQQQNESSRCHGEEEEVLLPLTQAQQDSAAGACQEQEEEAIAALQEPQQQQRRQQEQQQGLGQAGANTHPREQLQLVHSFYGRSVYRMQPSWKNGLWALNRFERQLDALVGWSVTQVTLVSHGRVIFSLVLKV
jgi:hypothetical protein